VLIRHAATDADAKGLLLGSRDEPLSGLGNVQAGKVAEFLLDMKVRHAVFLVVVVAFVIVSVSVTWQGGGFVVGHEGAA
jgi:hypothetical protein